MAVQFGVNSRPKSVSCCPRLIVFLQQRVLSRRPRSWFEWEGWSFPAKAHAIAGVCYSASSLCPRGCCQLKPPRRLPSGTFWLRRGLTSRLEIAQPAHPDLLRRLSAKQYAAHKRPDAVCGGAAPNHSRRVRRGHKSTHEQRGRPWFALESNRKKNRRSRIQTRLEEHSSFSCLCS